MSLKQAPENNDITLSKEETERLEECFKDKKFRDLLSDYVKEISNPKTKLAYEEYLKQIENEGGAPENRQLMKPYPEFCIKAKIVLNENDKDSHLKKKHIYINCCSGKLVKDAILANSNGYDHVLNSTGSKQAGLCWQIPYILGLKRFDTNDGSIIYDICFSSNTIKLSQSQESFKSFVITTALEAIDDIENDYKLYVNGKKWKILKSVRFKGNTEPPVMSVFISTDDQKQNNRMVDTQIINTHKIMKYKIIESTDKNIQQTWSDTNLLIEPLKRPKQIYIIIKLNGISGIKDIDCIIDIDKNTKKYFIVIKTKNKTNCKYKPCKIDLSRYQIIKSSMNASWYKLKQELKITFDIAPFTQTQIKEIQEKYNKLNIHNNNLDKSKEDEFLFKEVETKPIIQENSNNNNNNNNDKHDVDDEKDKTPLCHHKIPMIKQWAVKKQRHFWICGKSQEMKCTAFRWDSNGNNVDKIKLKQIKDFEVEKREKFDKFVLLIRIRNIFESSVDIEFDISGEIIIKFETHKYKYYKCIQLNNCQIDIQRSRFDLNCRNLLILIHKKKQKMKQSDDDKASIVNEILNDSMLFEI